MMRSGRQALMVLLLASVAGQGGCWFKRAPKAPAPPAAPAAKVETPKALPAKPRPLEEPQSPPVQLPVPEQEPTVIRPKLETPPPPKPPPAKRRPIPAASKPKPVEPQPNATEPGAQPATVAGPALGEVLSDSQRQAYRQTLEENLAQAKRYLGEIRGRSLTREHAENATRVRAFVRQAEEARGRDLGAAVQLSRRAALLARDLVESLR
ncbi:MAG: hypothetical protein HY858_04830 [Candidatus Solibacter usitatus]|nr:hypothetical protein [Candidatus Solibacter usitatus]